MGKLDVERLSPSDPEASGIAIARTWGHFIINYHYINFLFSKYLRAFVVTSIYLCRFKLNESSYQ